MKQPISSSPVAVIDTLNSLLEAEINSLVRFMDEGSPYLGRASVELRRPLLAMVTTSRRHADELADLIDALGGIPAPRGIQPEEQYLAYLSIKFLLPKLAEDKRLMIERYTNALAALAEAPAEVRELLQRHLNTHQDDLAVLGKAS